MDRYKETQAHGRLVGYFVENADGSRTYPHVHQSLIEHLNLPEHKDWRVVGITREKDNNYGGKFYRIIWERQYEWER